MRYNRKMPKDIYELVDEGKHLFRVTDIISEDEYKISTRCEVVNGPSEGRTLKYDVNNEEDSKYFWLTQLFLKCLKLPYEGDITIDPDEWIGREFYGEVKHKDGYANIKKLIIEEESTNENFGKDKTGQELPFSQF